jgi:hypothetical protein
MQFAAAQSRHTQFGAVGSEVASSRVVYGGFVDVLTDMTYER